MATLLDEIAIGNFSLLIELEGFWVYQGYLEDEMAELTPKATVEKVEY